MDIIKIKAEVYQLEQQGKRLPILHYLQDVWQQEPQSEGLTVLALRQIRWFNFRKIPRCGRRK